MHRHEYLATLYVPAVSNARRRISRDMLIKTLFNPETSTPALLGFLVHFSALGVQLTDPAESWMRRAGQRCTYLGYGKLGQNMIIHARRLASLHRMHRQDLQHLCDVWNQSYEFKLDTRALLEQPATDTMRRYLSMHEETIAGNYPFGEIAIEYEIKGIFTLLGPRLILTCRSRLGDLLLEGLNFISEHAELGVGHTAINEAEFEAFLSEHPTTGGHLAKVGSKALTTYLDFLGECVSKGQRLANLFDRSVPDYLGDYAKTEAPGLEFPAGQPSLR